MEELLILLGRQKEDQLLCGPEAPPPLCHNFVKPVKEECIKDAGKCTRYKK